MIIKKFTNLVNQCKLSNEKVIMLNLQDAEELLKLLENRKDMVSNIDIIMVDGGEL